RRADRRTRALALDHRRRGPAGCRRGGVMADRDRIWTRIGTLQYTAMEHVAMRWPEPVARAIFRAYGYLTWRCIPSSREIVAGNLARVLGRPDHSELVQAATREAFALYARYWYDMFHARMTPADEVNKRFVMEDRDII